MATWGIPRTMAALVSAAGLALVMGGCAATQTDAARPLPSEPAATSTSTPSPATPPAAAPTPSTAPDPAVTCETVFTDDVYTKLETDGLTYRGAAISVNPRLQALVDTSLSCSWVKPSTDIYAWYAQWPSEDAQWESLRAELLSDGYTEISDPLPGIIEAPVDPEYKPALIYRDGVVHYASAAQWLGSVRSLQ